MANCSICKGPGAQLGTCSDPAHLVHPACLQEMLDSVGADVALLKCPACGKELPLRTILGFQKQGIVVKNLREMVTELSKRKLVASLSANKMIA